MYLWPSYIVSIAKTEIAMPYIKAITRPMPRIFSQKPALHICGIVISPEAKTIALGGVATGIMNAQLAPIVMGTINNIGLNPNPSATV